MQFLGITLDTIKMQSHCTKKKITLQNLQSLIGTLQFVTSVIPARRPFLRRLVDMTIGVTKTYHKIRLARGAREDMDMWLTFLREYNGKSFFLHEVWLTSDQLNLYTDAATLHGYGAILRDRWLYGEWQGKARLCHINELEL